jgi:hypothetical protein
MMTLGNRSRAMGDFGKNTSPNQPTMASPLHRLKIVSKAIVFIPFYRSSHLPVTTPH